MLPVLQRIQVKMVLIVTYKAPSQPSPFILYGPPTPQTSAPLTPNPEQIDSENHRVDSKRGKVCDADK